MYQYKSNSTQKYYAANNTFIYVSSFFLFSLQLLKNCENWCKETYECWNKILYFISDIDITKFWYKFE